MDPEYQQIIHPVNIKIEEEEVSEGEIDLVELQYFIIFINQRAVNPSRTNITAYTGQLIGI